jgi:glucose uptake protein GlcU
MFGPALVLRRSIGRWPLRMLATVCAGLLVAGGACAVWAAAPFDLLGLAAAHGAAWSLAWAGQLWAPARRGQQGASPLRAAAGYAVLTLVFGVIVASAGARGVADVHAALGVAALVAWVIGELLKAWARDAAERRRIH